MNECTYKNYDELPLMLNVPTLKIGSRIVVPKDRLREWIDANTTQKWPRCNQRIPPLRN